MTNEQQKAKELAELLNAFAEGKQLQIEVDGYKWKDYFPNLDTLKVKIYNNRIRIKPEIKRVPLTQQDLIDRELRKDTISLCYFNTVFHISKYNEDGVYFAVGDLFSYEYLKENNYTFLDNTPCYKEVECE